MFCLVLSFSVFVFFFLFLLPYVFCVFGTFLYRLVRKRVHLRGVGGNISRVEQYGLHGPVSLPPAPFPFSPVSFFPSVFFRPFLSFRPFFFRPFTFFAPLLFDRAKSCPSFAPPTLRQTWRAHTSLGSPQDQTAATPYRSACVRLRKSAWKIGPQGMCYLGCQAVRT